MGECLCFQSAALSLEDRLVRNHIITRKLYIRNPRLEHGVLMYNHNPHRRTLLPASANFPGDRKLAWHGNYRYTMSGRAFKDKVNKLRPWDVREHLMPEITTPAFRKFITNELCYLTPNRTYWHWDDPSLKTLYSVGIAWDT